MSGGTMNGGTKNMSSDMVRRFLVSVGAGVGVGVVVLASLAGAAAADAAQPEAAAQTPAKTSDQRPAAREGREPIDRDRLRARLQRRLEETRKATTELEGTIRRLDDGAPVGEIAGEIERLAQSLRSGDGSLRLGNGREEGRSGPDGDRTSRFSEMREGRQPREGRGGDAPIDTARMMALLKEAAPEFAARVESLRAANPEAGERMLNRMAPRLRDALQVRAKDPELFELRVTEIKSGIEMLEAARAFRAAADGTDATATATARAALDLAAERQFDARVATQEREMHSLEARVEEIRGQLARKKSERDAMVSEFVERMVDQMANQGASKTSPD